MKLQEIEINNYRSIENLKVSMDDFIVLIGENNSGKSSILKGIELFYSESLKSFNTENFHFKDTIKPIEIILTFDRLTNEEKEQKYIKHWIHNGKVKIKRVVSIELETQKLKNAFYGWQTKPLLEHFDLSKFDDYKANLAQLVTDNNLPDYFKTAQAKVTQVSYKEGLRQHREAGLVELGEAGWILPMSVFPSSKIKTLPRLKETADVVCSCAWFLQHGLSPTSVRTHSTAILIHPMR